MHSPACCEDRGQAGFPLSLLPAPFPGHGPTLHLNQALCGFLLAQSVLSLEPCTPGYPRITGAQTTACPETPSGVGSRGEGAVVCRGWVSSCAQNQSSSSRASLPGEAPSPAAQAPQAPGAPSSSSSLLRQPLLGLAWTGKELEKGKGRCWLGAGCFLSH